MTITRFYRYEIVQVVQAVSGSSPETWDHRSDPVASEAWRAVLVTRTGDRETTDIIGRYRTARAAQKCCERDAGDRAVQSIYLTPSQRPCRLEIVETWTVEPSDMAALIV